MFNKHCLLSTKWGDSIRYSVNTTPDRTSPNSIENFDSLIALENLVLLKIDDFRLIFGE